MTDELAVLARIAKMLMLAQGVERLVRYVVTYVIQEPGKPLNIDRLHHVESVLSEKSLGQLLTILEARTDLHPEFKGVVESFLADRNTLAHDLDSVGGAKLHTTEGRDEMLRFLDRLTQSCGTTMRVFSSLILSHAEQLDRPRDPTLDPAIDQFIGDLKGIETNTFFAKYSQQWRRGKRGEILSDQSSGWSL